MTNREKYAKEILNIACAGKRIAVKNGVPCDCSATDCGECDLSQGDSHCSGELVEWCNSKYIEPPVDWSKVPIDTPILVRDSEAVFWVKRHFARYQNGVVVAFRDGRTSWSSDGGESCWSYAKIPEDDELNANSILRADRRKEE